ncbi:MAG: site-2 protease family protein [Armatimonadota bacterium]
MGNFDAYSFALSMAALVICITIHEFAHAYAAYRAGDDTPRLQGRLSLNPLDHLDPMGTIMMVVSSISGFGIGWGKPVQINPANFRHPRWDNLKMSLWGPLSNLLTAAAAGLLYRLAAHLLPANVVYFLWLLAAISVGLALFNLLPVAPLDGSHIVSSLLPYRQARSYDIFMARYGFFIFIGLIFLAPGVLPGLIGPPARMLIKLLMGQPVG